MCIVGLNFAPNAHISKTTTDTGSCFNVRPLQMATENYMELDKVAPDILAIYVQGGKLMIEGTYKVICLTGADQRMIISFIVCDLQEDKDPT